MMKITIAVVAILGIAVAFPDGPILTRSEIRDDFNQYALSYSTVNGIAVAQRGALKPIQTDKGLDNVLVQEGSWAYYGPDGKLYKFSYIADENGYQVMSDDLPVAPAIPTVPEVVVA